MADIEITVEGGSSARLLTAGKYCDRNILVTATGGGGGGTSASPSDVNFYDYDGTLLYSYTIAEANLLTEMPQPPTHDGLTFQGWNYSIEEVQSTTRRMDVGATYITSDGKTRLYISVPANSEPGLPPPRNQVPLYFRQTVANGVTIDWGDGSEPETLPGTGVANTTHTYATAGDFVISLSPVDGCELELGTGSRPYCVIGSTSDNGVVYCTMLKLVEVGRNVPNIGAYSFYKCYSLSSIVIPDSVTSIESSAFNKCYSLSSIVIPGSVTSIESSAFNSCYSLSSVVIPDNVTSIGSNSFYYCYSLSSVVIPGSVTSIGSNSFYYCYSLSSVVIPDSVTSIESNAFGVCYSLSSIVIPGSVTSIESNAFYSCYGIKEYHCKPLTPPTLLSKNAFSGIPSDCIIYVPVGSLESYKTATNWSAYASYMQEEPA